MKKLFALACVAIFIIGFISCGPSEEERKADSTDVAKNAQSMASDADSMIAAMSAMNNSDSTPAPADSSKADTTAQQ